MKMDHLLDAYNRATGGNYTTVSMKIEDLGSTEIECVEHGKHISHGVRYMGKREIWSQCPDCKEASLAAERMEKAKAEMLRMQEKIRAMIDDVGVPARFIGRTFDNFCADSRGQAEALRVAQAYANEFAKHRKSGAGLILSGLPGTGKSHLAAAILQGVIPEYTGLYVTCMGIIRAVRNTWRKDSEKSETQVLHLLCEIPLLVIDEVGVQYGTDGEQTILFDVLDRRYREMMPTILLTNQAKAGFKQFIGERSFDRLVETSRWVAFDWPSYRATARKEAA
jgi:DNA replication protein DnaC